MQLVYCKCIWMLRLFVFSLICQWSSNRIPRHKKETKPTFSSQNVSFSLRPGLVTALVGPSGGGKSSCMCLLENFYAPKQGQVLVDGQPVKIYQHKYYHSKVGYMLRLICHTAFRIDTLFRKYTFRISIRFICTCIVFNAACSTLYDLKRAVVADNANSGEEA